MSENTHNVTDRAVFEVQTRLRIAAHRAVGNPEGAARAERLEAMLAEVQAAGELASPAVAPEPDEKKRRKRA